VRDMEALAEKTLEKERFDEILNAFEQ